MEKEALEEAQICLNREEQKRAWTYSRIDAPDDAHGRLKSQKKELYDYAEQLGFAVVGSSEDLSGGLDFKRAGIMEAMKAAADGKFDVLLVKRLVCLGRDTTKTLEFLRGMAQLGIKLYSPLEGQIQLEYHSPSLSPR